MHPSIIQHHTSKHQQQHQPFSKKGLYHGFEALCYTVRPYSMKLYRILRAFMTKYPIVCPMLCCKTINLAARSSTIRQEPLTHSKKLHQVTKSCSMKQGHPPCSNKTSTKAFTQNHLNHLAPHLVQNTSNAIIHAATPVHQHAENTYCKAWSKHICHTARAYDIQYTSATNHVPTQWELDRKGPSAKLQPGPSATKPSRPFPQAAARPSIMLQPPSGTQSIKLPLQIDNTTLQPIRNK